MGAKVSLFTRNTAQMKEFCAGASFYRAVKSAKSRSSIGGLCIQKTRLLAARLLCSLAGLSLFVEFLFRCGKRTGEWGRGRLC